MKKFLFVIIPLILSGIVFFYFVENDLYFRADVRNFLIDSGLKSDVPRPYYDSDNKPFAYHALNEKISILQSSNKSSIQNIPSELVISSGVYTIYENVYELQNEGLYRFIFPGIENSQRIVYDGKNVENLLSAVSWVYTHGNSDSGKSFNELTQKAMHSKVFGICNTISAWLLQTLHNQNISARLVQTITLDDWNTYDNGHTMIEVYRDDLEKWVLYDLDNNAFFSSNGIPLSLTELIERINSDDYDIIFVASDTTLDVSNFKSKESDYDYAFIGESISSNEDSLRHWYKRVIQVGLIQDDDLEFYFSDNINREKIENFAPNYHHVEKTEFISRFYD